MTGQKALVLFSGGQDSTVCLAWALGRYQEVETVRFAYGQRHAVELEVALDVRKVMASTFPDWGTRLGQDHHIDLSALGRISETALTRDVEMRMSEEGLPNTFVPGRNLLFFQYAAALAYRRGISALIGGMCETDYSGYPDCRQETLQALAQVITLGMGQAYDIVTPLMYVDKAGTWALADKLGGKPFVDLINRLTHTCYLGVRDEHHDWGVGCGACPACDLRAKGWQQWQTKTT